jgi:hypothetical protein
MPVGFLWFGPLFGKALAIFFVSNLLIAWVLAHSIEAWQASSWGLTPDSAPWVYALNAGFFNWRIFPFVLAVGRPECRNYDRRRPERS